MPDLTITIAGSGDAFGSGGKMNTCFHIKTAKQKFLIDCGASSVVALKRQNLTVQDLDYVFISHLHGDHFGGLPFLILDSIQNSRNKTVTIVGPQDIEERTWQLFDLLYPGSVQTIDKSKFLFRTYISFEEFTIGHLSVKPIPVIHSETTYPHGLRIKIGGKVLGYSGDSSWTDSLINIASNTDLFICECCYYDLNVKGHLNYITLLEKLPILNAKRILLTHMDQQLLNRIDELALESAFDGMIITL